MKRWYLVAIVGLGLLIAFAGCRRKERGILYLEFLPLDIEDSTELFMRFNGSLAELGRISTREVPIMPPPCNHFPLYPMTTVFTIAYEGRIPTLAEVNSLYEIINVSEKPQRVYLYPYTGMKIVGVSTDAAWMAAFGRHSGETLGLFIEPHDRGERQVVDSLWRLVEERKTNATATIAPGETHRVLFQVR